MERSRIRSRLVCLTLAASAWSFSQTAALGQPDRATDKVSRAGAFLQRKDYPRALALSEEVLAAEPQNAVALATRGNIYIEMGEYQRALADHDLVLQMAPRDPGALMNACWARALANTKLDAALGYCDQAVALSRGRPFAAYDTRGFLHIRRGEYALAIADYDAALSKRAKLASSLYGRGIAELRLGQDAAARADLEMATKLEPTIGEVYAKRGVGP